MRIKKDDMVVVITGKDKGKVGKVLKAMPKTNKVVVEGVNLQEKHQKATASEQAQIKHVEGAIDASNVMYYDDKAKKPIKIAYEVRDGHKVRVDRATREVID
jgi:large subunit ribosomal protein L24